MSSVWRRFALSDPRAGIGRLIGTAAVAACVVAHIFASQHYYMTLTGPLLVLDHGFDLLAPLALLALATGVGVSALRMARIPVEGAAERLLFATALGIGITATSLLAVLAAAGVSPAGIVTTLVGLAVLCRRDLACVPALASRTAREVLAAYSVRARWFICLPIAAASAAVLSLALLPPLDWDSLHITRGSPAVARAGANRATPGQPPCGLRRRCPFYGSPAPRRGQHCRPGCA